MDMQAAREQCEAGWWTGTARCRECGHTWLAVAPDGIDLECPKCHQLAGEAEVV